MDQDAQPPPKPLHPDLASLVRACWSCATHWKKPHWLCVTTSARWTQTTAAAQSALSEWTIEWAVQTL